MINHLSISQLGTFTRCAEQYRRRYILGHKIAPGVDAHVGISVHRASQKNFENKKETEKNLEKSDLRDIAATEYDKSLSNGVFLSHAERSAASEILGKGKDAAVSLINPLHDDYFPTVKNPLIVEGEFWIYEPDLLPIKGYIDLYDDTKRLSDLKTRSSRMNQSAADKSQQITIYGEMIRRETGDLPKTNTLDVLVKNKKPVYQQLNTIRHETDWHYLKLRFDLMQKQLEAGLFPPTSPDQWICNPKWCGYWRTCRYISPHLRDAKV